MYRKTKCVTMSKRISSFAMVAAAQLRIKLVLLSLAAIIYILLAAYKVDVVQRFQDAFVGIDTQHYIPCQNQIDKAEHWSSNENFTFISREFFNYLASHLSGTPFPGAENYTQYIVAKSRLKPLPGVKQLRADFGPVLNDVTSFRYPIKIQPCRYKPSGSAFSVLVVVISAPSYFKKRDIIRRTWLRHLQMQSDLDSMDLSGFGFIVGLTEDRETQKRIEEESETYGDILQIEMMDDYYNLTLKAAALFNWINDHCSQVDFVLKVDDDVYVNAKNLVKAIATVNSSEQSIYGSVVHNPPQREGKWEISLEDWPWSTYPTYFSGGGVLMPGITIAPILAASQTIPYMPFDDTFFTGLCAAKAGIQVEDTYWMFVGALAETPEPCDVHNSITWLTEDINHFNESHRATENFYNNVTQCIVEESDGNNRTVDPAESISFSR